MIRYTALLLVVTGLAALSFKRWYAALCGLLLVTVFIQRPDFPTNLMGIQGLNPWNLLLLVIMTNWLHARRHDPPRAPSSNYVPVVFSAYVVMVLFSGLVAVMDRGSYYGPAPGAVEMITDTIINPLKYVVVGVLFFDGTTTRARLKMLLFSAVGSGLLYALMVFKTIRTRVFTIDYTDARRLTDKLVGLYANDMAELLAFAICTGFVLVVLLTKPWQRLAWLATTVAAIPPFLALKSRAGYLACCSIAVVLGAVRWRRLFLLFPLVVTVVLFVSPTVLSRIEMGFNDSDTTNWDEVSAGRTTYLWPAAIEQIKRQPIVGNGRYTIKREPRVYQTIEELGGRVPAHPHNSYLECLMDAGIIGLMISLLAVGGLLVFSVRLLRMRSDPLVWCLGAAGVCSIVAELAAGVAGSSFWATQSTVPYLAVWGAVLAVHDEYRVKVATRKRMPQIRTTVPAQGATRVTGIPS